MEAPEQAVTLATSGNGRISDAPVDPAGSVAVSIVILTFNEQTNIADCLQSCAWCDDVHVVDSGSTDGTVDIARSMGAQVHFHPFKSFGDQRNWAIDEIAHRYEWVFHLDADERFTPDLVQEIHEVLARHPAEAGFYVPHKLIFMGRWVRHAEGGYPIYQMRLFHKSRMRFRDYGHGQREDTSGSVGLLTKPYLHYNFSKGLEEWIDKHNRYSTLEAHEAFEGARTSGNRGDSLFGNVVQRRRFFKSRVYRSVPGTWMWRFVWMYVLRLGFLDGLAGLQYCLLVCTYDLFTSLKLSELERLAEERNKQVPSATMDTAAVHAGNHQPPLGATPQRSSSPGQARPAREDTAIGREESTPAPIAQSAPHLREQSPWTMREKLGRVLWMIAQATLFRTSFHNWYGWRRRMLCCFGAQLGQDVRIRPTARIEVPWNLEIGDYSTVGDHAILYSLGKIRIGRLATISQYAHLCAGTHDYADPSFPLLRPPINIGDEAWIAADAFVGPGVTIGHRSIVGARATVVKDVPADLVVVGNPARAVKPRLLRKAGRT